MKSHKLLIPVPEARSRLGGIGQTTIYELFKSKELVRVNIGRRAFVTEHSIQQYVERLEQEATASE